MEHLPGGGVVGLPFQLYVLASAVGSITRERKAKVLKVNANLMGTPGVQRDLHQGGILQPFQNPITRARLTSSPGFNDRH